MNLTPTHKYDDIIHLPHHVSSKRPHMSLADRAAQFSPFAALTGFEEAVNETARLTEQCIELEDEQIETINRILIYISRHLKEHPEATITFFQPDTKKAGGSYNTITGIVKAIDQSKQIIHLEGDQSLFFHQILNIDSPILPSDREAD
ncbi:MAG: hypothetical protein IJ079_05640 [Lachnospiraceae bacterium]|nr:hypothetical protein [Lachnospiraceae bacterium]